MIHLQNLYAWIEIVTQELCICVSMHACVECVWLNINYEKEIICVGCIFTHTEYTD